MTGDRWWTAYDGSTLNRPDEIIKKHFIGQAGADPSTSFRSYPGVIRCAVIGTNFTGHGGAGQ
jgi:hypothetical protein